jgi:RHS repeat-associated protein
MSLTVDDGSPVTTDYALDVNAGLPVVLDDGTNEYVYGLNLISATDSSDNQAYYTHDGLGSTIDLTDDTGDATDTYSYDVFGAVRDHTGTSTNPFEFAGQQTDADSGLQYLRARYHDPATGRFLEKDPLSGSLSSPQSQNPYAYGLNNPVNFVDPSGMTASEGGSALTRPVLRCGRYDLRCFFEYQREYRRYFNAVIPFLRQYLACVELGISLLSAFGGPAGVMAGGAAIFTLEIALDEDPVGAAVGGGTAPAPNAVEYYLKETFRTYGVLGSAEGGEYAAARFFYRGGYRSSVGLLTAFSAYSCARAVGLTRLVGI